MESISSVCINCPKVQSICFPLAAKTTLWMCWKECIRSTWMSISRYLTQFLHSFQCQRITPESRKIQCLFSQKYPVKDLMNENIGTALSDVRGVVGILKLVWNQTWPLFQRPHVASTFQLCYLMFVLFSIGHGTFMWWVYCICFFFLKYRVIFRGFKVSRFSNSNARLYWWPIHTVQHCWQRLDSWKQSKVWRRAEYSIQVHLLIFFYYNCFLKLELVV